MPAEHAPIGFADLALPRHIFGLVNHIPVEPDEMPRLAAGGFDNIGNVAQGLLDLADEVVGLELRLRVPADLSGDEELPTGGDDALSEGIARLPGRLSAALACDWSAWADRAAAAAASFIVGRGYGLGCVRELALKVAEVLRVPTIGHSAAELRHGPRASVTPATPVLVLRQNDEAAIAIDDLFRDLGAAGESLFLAGGAAGTLPWIGDDHPICDPVVMLVPAYCAIEAAARRRGYDPDNPPHLTKVTRTL